MKLYPHLLDRLVNQPLAIRESKLQVLTEAIIIPLLLQRREDIETAIPVTEIKTRDTTFKVATIQVFDSLVSKNGAGYSGITSYENISAQIDSFIAAGVQSIVFYLDSPGGEAFGLFSLTEKIRGLASRGIKTLAYTDGLACSACYAIGAACSVFYAAEASLVGSIGVIMTHIDVSARDEQNGVVYTILRSKSEKALGDSHTPLTDTAKNKMMVLLDSLDTLFNNDVLAGRENLTLENLLDFKGSEYMATEALSLGLIDKLSPSIETAFSDFTTTFLLNEVYMPDPNVDTNKIASLEAELLLTKNSLRTLSEGVDAQIAAQVKAGIAAGVKARMDELPIMMNNASALRLPADLAIKHFLSGKSVESSRDSMTELLEYVTPVIDPVNLGASSRSETFERAEPAKVQQNIASLKAVYEKANGKIAS